MAIRAHAQAEPIPGYKLIERLGAGGFGEVWKAEAPGGLLKAIKFVHGTLHSASGDETAVQQELKSLNRVKSVRHPYILSLERYDIVDGQLMIVMELADKNLQDRATEYTKKGLKGIPREELMRYMEEAAEALDLMNIQYGLQHLDIKPANLFLVHNHVKVADFGLVKDLEGMNTQVTGGVTPLYAAPETFDGVISRYCDQYNLGIVYQELLTGQRPFNGTSVRQLLMQHLTAAPDLKGLPSGDQPVIARALSKKPDDRFPSCGEMVQALRQAGLSLSALRKDARPAPAQNNVVSETPPPTATPPEASPGAGLAPLGQPRPPTQTIPAPAVGSVSILLQPKVIAKAPPRKETTGDGVLVPALVVGVGGLGRQVLQQVRQGLLERCGLSALPPHIQMLYVETDAQAVQEAFAGPPGAALGENEIILARLNKPSHYLRPGRERISLDSWLNMNMLCRLPRNQTTVDGLRLLGRLALADNYRSIAGKVKTDLTALGATSALHTADRQTKLGVRTSRPRAYVIAGLSGGSGSGMFIDLAYVVRRQMQAIGVVDPEVIGLLLLPAADRNVRKNPGLVNAFAALRELEHFSSSKVTYTSAFDPGEEAFHESAAPFDRCVVMQLPEETNDPAPTEDVLAWGADYVCRDLATPLGRAADEARAKSVAEGEAEMTCQSFGAFRFATPRRALLQRVARSLAHKLVQGWLTSDRALVKAVRAKITEFVSKRDLTPEGLIAALQAACAQSLAEAPETRFESIVHSHLKAGETPEPEKVFQAMQLLEAIVGGAQEEGAAESVHTPMIDGLDQAARQMRKDWELQLVELLRELMDEPRLRVIGAEEAGQQLSTMLEEAVERQQPLLQDLYQRAEEAYLAIDELTSSLRKGSWWPGRKTRMADDLRQALEVYPKARYQALVLESLLEVYQAVLQKLPKRLEEFQFCRQRVADLLQSLDDRNDPDSPQVKLGPGRHFFPANCANLDEAADALLAQFKPEELGELDGQIQDLIRKQFKSVHALCLAGDETFQEFQTLVLKLAETQVATHLDSTSVAAVYLQQHNGDREVKDDLVGAFEEAAPLLPGQRYSGAEVQLLAAPDDEAGTRLAQLAQEACPEAGVFLVKGAEDVYFYRERTHVPLAELPQLGLMAEEVYKQMTASGQFTPHTRTDITEWETGH